MPDDIRTDHAVSRTERKPGSGPDAGGAREAGFRYVGPESEVRGGPEAPPTNKTLLPQRKKTPLPRGKKKPLPRGKITPLPQRGRGRRAAPVRVIGSARSKSGRGDAITLTLVRFAPSTPGSSARGHASPAQRERFTEAAQATPRNS